jgi:hypothetical protein
VVALLLEFATASPWGPLAIVLLLEFADVALLLLSPQC